MRRVLVDVNVLLDVVLRREPWVDDAIKLWTLIEERRVEGFLAGHAAPTVFYIVRKQAGAARARQVIRAILEVFEVAATDKATLLAASESALIDLEDAVSAEAARSAECDWIVTRDTAGFAGSPIPSIAPAAALALLNGG